MLVSVAWSRVKSNAGLKIVLTLVLNPLVYLPYYFFQRHHFFPAIAMPQGFVDRMIPFSSSAVWFYLSIYLLMPLAPLLMHRKEQLIRYTAGILLISLAADTVFFFWPTFCPRPPVANTGALYRSLVAIDNPFHAFPSLHAAFAVYTALCAQISFRELQIRWIAPAAIWIWTFLILYATLATKQHVTADIAAGSLLATAIYFCVFAQRAADSIKKLFPATSPCPATTNSTPV